MDLPFVRPSLVVSLRLSCWSCRSRRVSLVTCIEEHEGTSNMNKSTVLRVVWFSFGLGFDDACIGVPRRSHEDE